IPGDIGDRDERMPAALVFGIGLGPNRIVEIARIGTIDRDERDLPQILALAERHRLRFLGERERLGGERSRDAVGVDRNEAEGARIGAIAQPLDNARFREAEPTIGADFGKDDLAILRIAHIFLRDAEFAPHLAIGRLEAAALMGLAEDAENAIGRAIEGADDPRLPAAILAADEADDRALADAARARAALGPGAQ